MIPDRAEEHSRIGTHRGGSSLEGLAEQVEIGARPGGRFARWSGATVAVVLSTLVSVLLAEVCLRGIFGPGDFLQPVVIADADLGHKIAARSAGHDALGFRNKAVPAHASIVAIGDS